MSVTLLGSDDGVLELVEHLRDDRGRCGAAGPEAPGRRRESAPAPGTRSAPTFPRRQRRRLGVVLDRHAATPSQRARTGSSTSTTTRATTRSPPSSRRTPPRPTPLPGTVRCGPASRTGPLVAVAAVGPNSAGAPHLTSVAVDTALRGLGLGRALVGALTRRAVRDHGVVDAGDVLPQHRGPPPLPLPRLRQPVRLVEPRGGARRLSSRVLLPVTLSLSRSRQTSRSARNARRARPSCRSCRDRRPPCRRAGRTAAGGTRRPWPSAARRSPRSRRRSARDR